MKIVAALLVVALLLIPGVALAGGSEDAALALGAFAVFNQIISGTGVFGGAPVVVAPRPVYAAPQPVYVAPQPVYVAPQPVYVAPPPPIYVAPRPVYVAPHPVVVYRSYPHYSYPHYHRAGHGHWKHDGHDRGHRGPRH